MILHKPEDIFYIFNINTKKIYIEETSNNEILRITLTSVEEILRSLSMKNTKDFILRTYSVDKFYSVSEWNRDFYKHFSERFSQK